MEWKPLPVAKNFIAQNKIINNEFILNHKIYIKIK